MVGYTGTPLVKKLGIKEGFKLYVKNPPDNYMELISPIPDNVLSVKRLSNDLDMIHFFTKRKSELISNIDSQMAKIKSNGMIWVSINLGYGQIAKSVAIFAKQKYAPFLPIAEL